MKDSLPKCAVLTCPNAADPRWFARDVNGHAVMICDGHDLTPTADEVTVRPPDPSAYDLAERIIYNGYRPTAEEEVERIAVALIAETARVKERDAELAELRDLADLVDDADILALPPELREVRLRWVATRCHQHQEQEVATGVINDPTKTSPRRASDA